MPEYKVSVIIPVYNAQNTIKRCINSVISQTIGFSNIELLLYDDSSTDNTRKILKEYSDSYENIVVILSDENSGYAGNGRNEGIKRATADYVMFMDNDDAYEEDICEILYNAIISADADIVSCDAVNIDGNHHEVLTRDYKGTFSENNKITFLNDDRFNFKDILVWNKIFKKSTIINNNVEFPKGAHEDIYFTLVLLIYVNKIVYLKNYVGYNRYIQIDSITSGFYKNYDVMRQAIDVYSKVLSEYKNSDVRNYNPIVNYVVTSLLVMTWMWDLLDDKKEIRNLLNFVYSVGNEMNFNGSSLGLMERIAYKLIMKSRFNLAILYLKSLSVCHNSEVLKKVYRKIIN